MILIGSLDNLFTTIGIWICAGVYWAASKIFQVFMLLAGNSVVDSSTYSTFLQNIYIIIGVIMLFTIAFFLLQVMVSPDDSNKGTTAIKKMIVNFVTSILIIILLPTIFTFLYNVQASILNNNSIGQLFGYDTDTTATDNVTSSANRLVNSVWTAFFNVNEEYCQNLIEAQGETYDGGVDDISYCQASIYNRENYFFSGDYSLTFAIEDVTSTGNYYLYLKFSKNVSSDESISFNFILSFIAGLALLYVGVSYCLDMGVRYVKLIFYQLIAPIPVLLRIVPEGKMASSFNEWLKITLTCYLEVFVRILVLYFCLWMCDIILDSNLFASSTSAGGFVTLLATVCILMGIIVFMKQAPKLIGQVLGIDSGNMKLGIGEKLKESVGALSMIPGAQALGTLGMKTLSGIDSKRNGGTFADGFRKIQGKGIFAKARHGLDTVFPYSADAREGQRKADTQRRANAKTEQRGRELNAEYNNSTDDYINQKGSQELKDANKEKKDAKKSMIDWQNELDAARTSGDADYISYVSEQFNNAKDKYDRSSDKFDQIIQSPKYSDIYSDYKAMKYAGDIDKAVDDADPNNNTRLARYRARRNSTATNDSNSLASNSQSSALNPQNVGGQSIISNNANNNGVGGNNDINTNNINANSINIPSSSARLSNGETISPGGVVLPSDVGANYNGPREKSRNNAELENELNQLTARLINNPDDEGLKREIDEIKRAMKPESSSNVSENIIIDSSFGEGSSTPRERTIHNSQIERELNQLLEQQKQNPNDEGLNREIEEIKKYLNQK